MRWTYVEFVVKTAQYLVILDADYGVSVLCAWETCLVLGHIERWLWCFCFNLCWRSLIRPALAHTRTLAIGHWLWSNFSWTILYLIYNMRDTKMKNNWLHTALILICSFYYFFMSSLWGRIIVFRQMYDDTNGITKCLDLMWWLRWRANIVQHRFIWTLIQSSKKISKDQMLSPEWLSNKVN